MLRKIFRTGNSTVVSLPPEALAYLNLHSGMEVEINLDLDNHQVILRPVRTPSTIAGVDEAFAQQVAEFIEQYRPALRALAR
jgi:antitoxin MazE